MTYELPCLLTLLEVSHWIGSTSSDYRVINIRGTEQCHATTRVVNFIVLEQNVVAPMIHTLATRPNFQIGYRRVEDLEVISA
jgi:hypothetical protein